MEGLYWVKTLDVNSLLVWCLSPRCTWHRRASLLLGNQWWREGHGHSGPRGTARARRSGHTPTKQATPDVVNHLQKVKRTTNSGFNVKVFLWILELLDCFRVGNPLERWGKLFGQEARSAEQHHNTAAIMGDGATHRESVPEAHIILIWYPLPKWALWNRQDCV